MKKLTVLFLLSFFYFSGNAQFVSAGYVTPSPIANSETACGSSTVSLQVYSRTGTTNAGDTLYTAANGSAFIADFSYYGWAATNGAVVTKTFQIWGDKVLRNVATCGSGGGGGATSAGFAPAPIAWGKKLKPKVMMDLSRFDQFGGGGGGMHVLFDDSTNTDWYPWRNPGSFVLSGYDDFHKIYWHGNRGLRMLFDLVGDSNILDLSKRYRVRDTVFYYDKTFNSGQATFHMAFVDSVIANVPWYNRHYYFARPDSLLKPFAVFSPNNGAASGGVWRKATILRPDSGRYVFVWATSNVEKSEFPNFGELSFYGIPNFDSSTVKHWSDYPLPAQHRDLSKFAGLNLGGLYYTKHLKDRYGLRMYSWPFYVWDKDSTTAYPGNVYDANPYNNQADWNIIDSLRELGTKPYFAIAGGNYRHRWQSGTSATGDLNKMPPVEHLAEIEDYNSYVRSADFFKHFAAKFGRNTKNLLPGSLRWNGENPQGLGNHWFDYVEDGNEEQHRTGLSELGYFLRASMDYDGHAGRYPLGIKAADDSMKLIMSATAAPDTNRTKMFVYFAHFFRPDSLFFFDAINQHHYSTTYAKTIGYLPTVNQMEGATGATPEYDSLKFRMKGIKESAFRYIRRYVDIDLTEYGTDNYQEPVPTPYQFLHTHLGTPDYPGYDSMQDKSIVIEATIMEGYAAGLNNMVEFISENPCFCPNNNPVLFATAGEIAEWTGYTATSFYTHHHSKNWHSRMLKGWAWDSEIRGAANDSVRVYKLRKIDAPDSVCYYVRYWPLDDAGRNVTLTVGNVSGNGTKKYLNFSDTPPSESAAVVSSGEVQVVAQARAQYYFFQETSQIAPRRNSYRTRARFKN